MARFIVEIEVETDDVEYPLTPDGPIIVAPMRDLIESLERTVPYMFDNVMITSREV